MPQPVSKPSGAPRIRNAEIGDLASEVEETMHVVARLRRNQMTVGGSAGDGRGPKRSGLEAAARTGGVAGRTRVARSQD